MVDFDNVTVPRIARLVKGEDGYGFNLHGDKKQPGQTISAVDKDSAADRGGLREGDRLIEVNGCNVEGDSHGEVVKKIKEGQNETTLLVCDTVTLAYLKENNRKCTADMANLSSVIVKPAPDAEPILANGDAKPEIVEESIAERAPVAVEESAPPPVIVTQVEDSPPELNDTTPDEVKELRSVLDEQDQKPEYQAEPVPQPEPVVLPEPVQPEPVQPEPQAVVHSEPAPVQPEPPRVEAPIPREPIKPFSKESARTSSNARILAKKSGQSWGSKVESMNKL